MSFWESYWRESQARLAKRPPKVERFCERCPTPIARRPGQRGPLPKLCRPCAYLDLEERRRAQNSRSYRRRRGRP